jgi:hypothetical protein
VALPYDPMVRVTIAWPRTCWAGPKRRRPPSPKRSRSTEMLTGPVRPG